MLMVQLGAVPVPVLTVDDALLELDELVDPPPPADEVLPVVELVVVVEEALPPMPELLLVVVDFAQEPLR
jgi:hypothetical protein